jgi:hypothetical protein
MRTMLRIVMGVLCLGSVAWADAPLVFCEGTACGEQGPRAYTYDIDSGSYPMMKFEVGTNDLNVKNYTDVLVPRGWNFTVEEWGMGHDHGRFTPHGEISTGPCRCLTKGRVLWWTEDPENAVEFFTFGFDHSWKPEDVAWTLTTRREGPPPEEYIFRQFWDAPVGMGMGPVHGPSVPGSGSETIEKAKCKVRHGVVKKATILVKNATPKDKYTCKLDTGQELSKTAKPSGKIKFKFSGNNAPPCGPNGATVRQQYKEFVCGC